MQHTSRLLRWVAVKLVSLALRLEYASRRLDSTESFKETWDKCRCQPGSIDTYCYYHGEEGRNQ